jgi:hypothetical protein
MYYILSESFNEKNHEHKFQTSQRFKLKKEDIVTKISPVYASHLITASYTQA